MKGDGFLKFRLLPDSPISPFVAGSVSAASAVRRECGYQSVQTGTTTYIREVCNSDTNGSIGGAYQAGLSLRSGKRFQVDIFWSQYFGTRDLKLNIFGIRGAF